MSILHIGVSNLAASDKNRVLKQKVNIACLRVWSEWMPEGLMVR